MKFAFVVSIAAAILAIAESSPISHSGEMASTKGFAVPLTRNPRFQRNLKAQVAEISQRYQGPKHLTGGSGRVPVVNDGQDVEYYGVVSFGTPPKEFQMVWTMMSDPPEMRDDSLKSFGTW